MSSASSGGTRVASAADELDVIGLGNARFGINKLDPFRAKSGDCREEDGNICMFNRQILRYYFKQKIGEVQNEPFLEEIM
jgi:hypothetical protein